MKYILFIVIYFYFIVLSSSCNNNKLTENNAAKAIESYMKLSEQSYPLIVTGDFPTSVIYKKAPSPRGFGKITLCLGAKYDEFKNIYTSLEQKKLITTSQKQDGCTYIHANITEEGKKYYVKKEKSGMFKDYSSHIVKTSEMEVDEITGIKETPEYNMAEVEFTMKSVNFTPFADALGKSNHKKIMCTAIFEKYNDGWRVSEISGLPGKELFY